MTATHLSVVRLELSLLVPCACCIEPASWARYMTATGSMMGPESFTKGRSGTISCSALAFSPLCVERSLDEVATAVLRSFSEEVGEPRVLASGDLKLEMAVVLG